MLAPKPLDPATKTLLTRIEEFEASASVANTGTGSRREGEGFERLMGDLWEAICEHATGSGASCVFVTGAGSRRWAKVTLGNRSLYLPNNPRTPASDPNAQPSRWLEVSFKVDDLVAAYPRTPEAIKRYAPETGPYQGDAYPKMFADLSTKFDDTILLEEAGVLKEKILLEYKTAKASTGRQIDGNAHERLSFQIMQYLEVATRYTKCSFVVIANGAFVRYRNKYHVNFHVQADRLTCFSWFTMQHFCTAPEYTRFIEGLIDWLLTGTPRPTSTR